MKVIDTAQIAKAGDTIMLTGQLFLVEAGQVEEGIKKWVDFFNSIP